MAHGVAFEHAALDRRLDFPALPISANSLPRLLVQA
jgi:hypothetical protein